MRVVERQKVIDWSLAKSEVQYRMLFISNPVPMWVFDLKNLRVLDVNHAATTLCGYATSELLRMTILDISSTESALDLLEYLSERLQGYEMQPRCWTYRRKAGGFIQIQAITHRISYGNRDALLVGVLESTIVPGSAAGPEMDSAVGLG